MKVLLISTSILNVPPNERYGGIEALCYDFCEELVLQGIDVSLAAPKGSKPPMGCELIETVSGRRGFGEEEAAYHNYAHRLKDFDCIHDFSHQKIVAFKTAHSLPALFVTWFEPVWFTEQRGGNPHPMPPYNIVALSKYQAHRFQQVYGYRALPQPTICKDPEKYKFCNDKSNRFLFVGKMSWHKGCIPKGHTIFTNPHPKDISDISIDDSVLGVDGLFHRVTEVYQRGYSGDLVQIFPYYINLPIALTPEHPVLVFRLRSCRFSGCACKPSLTALCEMHKCNRKEQYRPIWLAANNLRKGDFLLFPAILPENGIKTIKVTNYVHESELFQKERHILTIGRNQFGGGWVTSCHPIPVEIPISDNFMVFCGFFVAEGTARRMTHRGKKHGGYIQFSFGAHETEYIRKITDIGKNLFGFSPALRVKGSKASLKFNSPILGEVFRRWFGENSHTKKIPDWLMSLPQDKIEKFLYGLWRGDGCVNQNSLNGKSYTRFTYGTVSRTLALQLFYLLVKVGVIPSVRYDKTLKAYFLGVYGKDIEPFSRIYGIEYHVKERWQKNQRGLFYKGFVWLPIRKIVKVPFKGSVYNLEVEDVNSYVCNGVIVHNCLEAIKFAKELNVPLDVVGGKGVGDPPFYQNQVIDECDGKQICFYPNVTDGVKIKLMQHAKAVLYPVQFTEAHNMVLVESMMCGTPVITFDKGAMSAVVGSGGYCAKDDEDFKKAMEYVDEADETVYHDTHKYAVERYARAKVVADYIPLYKKVAEGERWR